MTNINKLYGAKYSKANALHQLVIQKGNVGSKYVYALQYGKNKSTGKETGYVTRSPRQATLNFNSNVLNLTGTSTGHTQTFEYAGQSGKWFIGTKGKVSSQSKYAWCSQMARVDIRTNNSYSANTVMPRLSYLNRAGDGLKVDGTTFSGSDLYRSEAAVSPSYQYFLLSTIDQTGNGYFTLYDLDTINNALDNISYDQYGGIVDVHIDRLPYLKEFKISGFTDAIESFQGVDLDDNLNIYVSSQLSGYSNRHLFKIPWGATEKYQWDDIDLTNDSRLDISGCYSEFESVQVISENDLYLTVSYHNDDSGKKTQNHRIFEVVL